MDPADAAKSLGSGTAQLILAVMLVFVTLVAVWLGKALHGCLVTQIDAGKKDMQAQIASNQTVADALKDVRAGIDGMVKVVDRLIDGKADRIVRIDPPEALALRRKPKANVGRYDTLRGKELRHAS